MSPQLNCRSSFPNPERPNPPSPTPTTHLRGTPPHLGPALLTSPRVASPPRCDRIQKALHQHRALLPALLQQPLTHLPSAPPHPRCPRGANPRTREWRDSPPRTTHSLWNLVSKKQKQTNAPQCVKSTRCKQNMDFETSLKCCPTQRLNNGREFLKRRLVHDTQW